MYKSLQKDAQINLTKLITNKHSKMKTKEMTKERKKKRKKEKRKTEKESFKCAQFSIRGSNVVQYWVMNLSLFAYLHQFASCDVMVYW